MIETEMAIETGGSSRAGIFSLARWKLYFQKKEKTTTLAPPSAVSSSPPKDPQAKPEENLNLVKMEPEIIGNVRPKLQHEPESTVASPKKKLAPSRSVHISTVPVIFEDDLQMELKQIKNKNYNMKVQDVCCCLPFVESWTRYPLPRFR
jgi:hypothetical protein